MTKLFESWNLGGVSLRNRVMISPMCQYSAQEGVAGPWHLAQYGRMAMGGAGLVMVEATSISAEGMGTLGDLGLWNDAQQEALTQIGGLIRALGAEPAIQLGHSGRKAGTQRPWHGSAPLTEIDRIERNELPWPVVAPSAIAMAPGWPVPRALSAAEIGVLKADYRASARRALEAGFRVIELHCAHGYLLHEFLSPLSNQREDAWGGSEAGRFRLPLEIIADLRALMPEGTALLVRISCVDGVDGGLEIEDLVRFCLAAKAAGADAIDCSSGGLIGGATAARIPRALGFQIPWAAKIRAEAGIPTIAVGLILTGAQAEAALQAGAADMIAVARAALDDPNWPLKAESALTGSGYASWPEQSGWWLEKREQILAKLAP